MTHHNAERPPKAPSRSGFIIPIGICFMLVMLGVDLEPTLLAKLDYLGVYYPTFVRSWPIVAPGLALVIWLALQRRSQILAAILAFGVWCAVAMGVLTWAGAQTEAVDVTKWLDPDEISAMEGRLGFKVFEQGDSMGTHLYVTRRPACSAPLRSELIRLGIYRP
jgi:hypothetical protein